MNPVLIPEHIFVEKAIENSELVKNIKQNCPRCRIHIVDRVISPDWKCDGRAVEVVDFKGNFLKRCPGTKNYICCGYKILHFGEQCSIGCTYCILQAYFPSENLRLFANWDRMLNEVRAELSSSASRFYRIGTGEFTDSLLFDPITEFSKVIVPFFGTFPNSILELKTKTDHIELLEGLNHCGRTIVAWSMNSKTVISQEEGLAVSLQRRLECAQKCMDWGYRLAFHFDPMIYYDGWEEDYKEVVDLIFDTINPERIVWISLGCFRFMPVLKNIIENKYPECNIIYGEFIQGLDGKLRYFKHIRIMMYEKMLEWISMRAPGVCVYLCMESPEVWREAFGFTPGEKGGLPAMLDDAAKSKCGD